MLEVNEEIDFWRDLDFVTKSLLGEFGIKYGKEKTTHDLLLDFLSVRRKMVPEKPKEVLITPLLKEKLVTHPKRAVVEHIEQQLRIGGNLNFFQTERLYQSRKHDHLVYEWGIHHFHLSLKKKKNSLFQDRTNDLLFVFITERKAILLDIRPHSNEFFADYYWVGLLQEYFPEEIKKYECSYDMPSSRETTPEERMALWEKGYSPFMFNVNNVSYSPPGLGRVTSGHSVQIVMQRNNVIYWINYASEAFFKHKEEMMKRLGISEWKLQLAITEYGFSIVEHQTKQILLVFPNQFMGFK